MSKLLYAALAIVFVVSLVDPDRGAALATIIGVVAMLQVSHQNRQSDE